jgi:predicted dehydrogenase
MVNVGFLGVGHIISKQHLPNAYNCPWLNVHTLCDLNSALLSKYQEQYGAKKTTTDYHEMLEDPEIDVVVVAVNTYGHSTLSIEAMEAGKHVYVEKPLSDNLEACMQVAEVSARTGRSLAVGYNRRFAPSYMDAYDIMKDEEGPIMITYRLVDDFRDRAASYIGRPRLLDECCHVFDVFNWFANSTPERVYATGTGRTDDHQVIVEYENGVTASLFTSQNGAFHWPKERMEIVGDHKVVAVEDFVEMQVAGVPGCSDKKYAGREYDGFTKGYAHMYAELGLPFYRQMRCTMADLLLNSGLIEGEPEWEKWGLIAQKYPDHLRIPINYSCDKGWYNALADFGKCIQENRKPRNTGAEGAMLTVATSLAAIESARRRMPVDIDMMFDKGITTITGESTDSILHSMLPLS